MSGVSLSNLKCGAWMSVNCTQLNNWVVINSFNEIFNHKDRKYFIGNILTENEKLVPIYSLNDLGHIYATFMSNDLLITVIKTRGKNGQYFLIRNKMNVKEEEDIEIKEEVSEDKPKEIKLVKDENKLPEILSIDSNIYKLDNLGDIVNILSSPEQNSLGIKKKQFLQAEVSVADLNKHVKIMKFVASENIDEYISNFIKSFKKVDKVNSKSALRDLEEMEILDLTNNYSITSSILSTIPFQEQITQIILNKNHQLENFEWLKNFPNVQLLDFRYMNNLTFEDILYITSLFKNLKVINLHFCGRINLRVLLPILKLTHIEKICIDDENFWCQKGAYELFIKPDEWENIDCLSLKTIAINSLNLTLDVIDYIIKACPNLTTFIMDTEVFNSAIKNVINGYSSETIILAPWQSTKKGVQLHRKIKFKNMYKDNYNTKVFTDSFMKTIEHQEERRQKLIAELEAELDAEELNETQLI